MVSRSFAHWRVSSRLDPALENKEMYIYSKQSVAAGKVHLDAECGCIFA